MVALARDDDAAGSTAANTMFVNLVVNGMAQGNTPAPNTVINVPGSRR